MIRQVSSYMTANVVSAMFGFASVVLFTRVLSPHEYGIYIIGFSICEPVVEVLVRNPLLRSDEIVVLLVLLVLSL